MAENLKEGGPVLRINPRRFMDLRLKLDLSVQEASYLTGAPSKAITLIEDGDPAARVRDALRYARNLQDMEREAERAVASGFFSEDREEDVADG
jgi:predicted transcriptional regulator